MEPWNTVVLKHYFNWVQIFFLLMHLLIKGLCTVYVDYYLIHIILSSMQFTTMMFFRSLIFFSLFYKIFYLDTFTPWLIFDTKVQWGMMANIWALVMQGRSCNQSSSIYFSTLWPELDRFDKLDQIQLDSVGFGQFQWFHKLKTCDK